MLPKSYLLTAPSDLENTFGNPLHSTDLVKGLRRINPQLCVPLPEHYRWYPGQKMGMTTLWLGMPGEGKKISAFRLGPIPEFTQLGPTGQLVSKGWRQIMLRCMDAKVVTARQLEREFKVVLETDGRDGTCTKCRKEGRLIAATSDHRLCDIHAANVATVKKGRESRKEGAWNRSESSAGSRARKRRGASSVIVTSESTGQTRGNQRRIAGSFHPHST